MRPSRQRRDEGASLALVLIIITVISAVLGVILNQVDTSLRTSVALRDQTENNYGTDAAAMAAINLYRQGSLPCSSSTATSGTLGTTTSPFYKPASSPEGPLDASYTCAPDTSISTGYGSVDVN